MNETTVTVLIVCLFSIIIGSFLGGVTHLVVLQWGEITPPVELKSVPDVSITSTSQTDSHKPASELHLVQSLSVNESNGTSSDEQNSKLDNFDTKSIQQLEKTKLPLELVGTTSNGPPTYRVAVIRHLDKRKIRSLGVGGAWDKFRIEEIHDNSVILYNQDVQRNEIIHINRQKVPGFGKKDDTKKDDVTRVTRYQINQAIHSNMNNLLGMVDVGPKLERGQIIGMEIKGMQGRPGKLLRNLGFEERDVITRVNGEKINSMDKAFSLWSQLKNQTHFKVSLRRDGKKRTLEYSLAR